METATSLAACATFAASTWLTIAVVLSNEDPDVPVRKLQFDPEPSPQPVARFPETDPISYGYFWFLVSWYALFAVGLAWFVHSRRSASKASGPSKDATVVVNPIAAAEDGAAVPPPRPETPAPLADEAPGLEARFGLPDRMCSSVHVEARSYAALLLLMLLAVVILFGIIAALRNLTDNETIVGVASGALTSIMLHMTLAPVVILLKLFGVLLPPSSATIRERARRTEGRSKERWVLKSASLTRWQRIMLKMLGIVNNLIIKIIELLAWIGIDLSVLYFPMPFVQLMERKMILDAVRVDGHRIALIADWHDAYLNFVFEHTMDMCTLTMWSRRCAIKTYNRWLDSRLHWVEDTPPEGCTMDGQFRYFSSSPTCRTRCWVWWCASCCPPFFGTMYATMLIEKDRVQNMKFGGRRIRLEPVPNFCEWILEFGVKSLCGLGNCWKRFLDSRVQWQPLPAKGDVEMASPPMAPPGTVPV